VKTTENPRRQVLSFALTEREMQMFNDARLEIENNNGRMSTSEFIRDHIVLPYLSSKSYLTKQEIPNIDPPAKTPTETHSEPVSEPSKPSKKNLFNFDNI
jgi:hypothetical protein